MRLRFAHIPIFLLLALGLYIAFKVFYWTDPTDCTTIGIKVIPPAFLIIVFEALWRNLAYCWDIPRGRAFPRCLLYFTCFNDFLLYPIFISLFIQGFRGLENTPNCEEIWKQKKAFDPHSPMVAIICFGVYSPGIKYRKLEWWRSNREMEELRERILNDRRRGFELENLRQL